MQKEQYYTEIEKLVHKKRSLRCSLVTVGLKDTQGKKKGLKGNAGENIYIGLVGMPKHQNEKKSSRESQVCHLTQAGQTA